MIDHLQTFIKKTALFLCLPLAGLVAVYWSISAINKKAFEDFKADKNVHIVFAGDSHIEQCIDDRLVPNSINIAQNSEVYFFNYYKLKKLLDNSPQVDTVYLGYSYHNLSDYSDDFVAGEFAPYMAGKYFFILPGEARHRLLTGNRENLSLFFKSGFRDGWGLGFTGGFENIFPETAAVPRSMEKRARFQYIKADGSARGLSTFQLEQLDRIAALCRERGAALILLNTPLHPFYKNLVPPLFQKEVREAAAARSLPMLDLENALSGDANFIPDGDHVSGPGAAAVSKMFAAHSFFNR